MIHSNQLVLGEVRQQANGLEQFRVIGLDEHQVHFDILYSNLKRWSFGLSPGKCYYHRAWIDQFVLESTHVRFQPLTGPELNLYRPDLPTRLFRTPSINWNFSPPCNLAEFESAACQAGLDIATLPSLKTPQVVLLASRLKASTRGVLCEATDGKAFSGLELLWHAQRVQVERGRNKLPGLGLFRMGHERKGVPSYLVGGYYEITNTPEEYASYIRWANECHSRGEKIV